MRRYESSFSEELDLTLQSRLPYKQTFMLDHQTDINKLRIDTLRKCVEHGATKCNITENLGPNDRWECREFFVTVDVEPKLT